MGLRRVWWFFAAVAAASFAGMIVQLVTVQPGAGSEALGAGTGAVVFGTIALILGRIERRAAAADRSGPVLLEGAEAAGRTGGTSALGAAGPAGQGGRWDLDEVAGELARRLAPMNGVVFREGRSRRLRIMLDPASAIQRETHERQPGQDGPLISHVLRGEWWLVTWRRGRPPRIRAKRSSVRLGSAPGIGSIPLWAWPGGTGQAGSMLREPVRPAGWSGELQISSLELMHIVDEVAVDSGWTSRGALGSVTRQPVPGRDRHVVVGREGEIGWTSTSLSDGTTEHSVTRETRTDSSTSTVGRQWTTKAGEGGPLNEEEIEKARALLPDSPPMLTPSAVMAGPAAVMTVIGVVILAACVLATVIGLLFGMVWWASFIIIGSGLLFCLIFVLPVRLLARS